MNSSGTTYNYGIDNDGQIGLFLDEPYPASATGDSDNDDRSVNIVCVNKTLEPDYEISKRCFDSLVDLCEDICRRNYIYTLVYRNDNPDISTLTIHSQFQKGVKCPGPYVKSKLQELQDQVNLRLGTVNATRVSVTSWQADSELAALRAQSTVSLGAIKPYVARISETVKNVSYQALQSIGVVGIMFQGGWLYKNNQPGHTEKKKFSNTNLYNQIDDFKVQNTGMPFAIEYTTRAVNLEEAKAECDAFYYIASKYRPKLGVWVRCDLSVKSGMAVSIIDFYYEKFIKWGFKSKCGIIASQKQAELIKWPRQASYMPLWLEGAADPIIAPKDEILTPSYFKLGNLSNWGYNEAEDRQRVEDYVEQLRKDLAIHQSMNPDAIGQEAGDLANYISVGGGTQADIYAFLLTAGMTPAGACGVMGNLMVESHFDYTAVSASGTFHGIAQWGRGRWTACVDGGFSGSLEGQLNYLIQEMSGNYGSVWAYVCSSGNDPVEAANRVAAYYEGCEGTAGNYAEYNGKYYQGLADRRSYASRFYQQLTGGVA